MALLDFPPWTPSSPRLSFSRDFVQSDVFNPSSGARGYGVGEPSPDFDFGMLALLRNDPIPAAPMLPADELFSNGRILPAVNLKQHAASAVGMPLDLPRPAVPQHPVAKSPSPSSRWRELFGIHHKSSRPEAEQVASGGGKCTNLRFLFRSSSAGAGRRDPAAEPCLGRSASESKASTCSPSCCGSCDARRVQEPSNAGGIDGGLRTSSSSSSSSSRVLPPSSQKHHIRRRTISDYQKLPSTGSTSFGSSASKTNNQNPHRAAGKKLDAWKAYGSVNSDNSLGSSGRVAQVLHMDVCMGQSMVASKVAKVFIKKEKGDR